MAIINCPECKGGVSDQAENCPHCGYKIPKKSGCFTIIAVLVGGLILFALLGKSPDSETFYDQRDALNSCESHIKTLLKNPDSAYFESANSKVIEPKPDFKTIFLTVRATNSFNAIVPTHYACFVRKLAGNWTVEDIQEVAE